MTRFAPMLLVATLAGADLAAGGPHDATATHSFVDVERWEKVFDDPARDAWQKPDALVAELGLRPGMVVADVGAGTGYMTFRMARKIAPNGKAYAEDLQPEMLQKLRTRAQRDKISNVETVLGAVNDPKLPAGQIDLVLLVDVYHEFSEPQAMLDRIRESLKPGGRLVLLEYRKEDPKVPIRLEHKMSVAEAKTEVEAEGYKLDEVIEKLPRQHIIIFKPAK